MISKKLESNIIGQKDLILICINIYVTNYSILIGSQNIETTWANEQIDLVIKPLQHLRKLSFSGLEVDIEESFWNGLHQIRTLPGQQPYLFDKIIMFYDLLAQAKGVPIQYDEATQGLRKVPGTTSS